MPSSDDAKVRFDPGLKSTAICKTAISYLDGEAGRLEYRGYPIEELVEKCTFLEVAYLLIYGELPNARQYADWQHKVMTHTFVHSRLSQLHESFNYDAHPMGMFIATMAAMSTFHKEANPALEGADLYTNSANEAIVNKQVMRWFTLLDIEDIGKDADRGSRVLSASDRAAAEHARCVKGICGELYGHAGRPGEAVEAASGACARLGEDFHLARGA